MPRPIHVKGQEEHMTALGYLCAAYSDLELTITKLIGSLLGLKGARLDSITNHVDMLKEIQIARALAFTQNVSTDWYKDVDLVLWHIETELMARRNRFVHDRWFPDNQGRIVRRWYRNRIRKKPPKDEELTTREDTPHSADDIWNLVDEIMIANGALGILRLGLKRGHNAELLPREFRDRWSARRGPLQESAAKQPLQQRKSSAGSRKQQKPSSKQRRLRALARTARKKQR